MYNADFTVSCHNVSVYRVPQMRGGGYADVLPELQVPDNKTNAVPCVGYTACFNVICQT